MTKKQRAARNNDWNHSAAGKAWWKAHNNTNAERQRKKAWRLSLEGQTYQEAYYKAHRKAILAKRKAEGQTHTPEYKHKWTVKDRTTNPSRYKAYCAADKAKRLGVVGRWTGVQFIALCKKYGNICLRCHKKRKLTPDHVIPFCKGGTNYISNIQPLCLPCNKKKGSTITDYRFSTTQTTTTQLRAA